jgi:diaminohydroxyphosphoribosylaminopyrimidine deaminase / 5-amino-6-(5-phosphoribosylamino)uracil reductase
MARALELAARGGRAVQPNPLVGAVLVKEGRVIGEGWHARCGEAHAERAALTACSEDPRAATLYVTMEPCHRQGRTPPCSEAILEAGISRVVYALEDPNPGERGRSHRLLAEAGVEVEGGLLAEEAASQNVIFVHRQRSGRPHVTLKSAATLNGMLARADGSSRWISGEASREEVHRLRAGVMAVAVGGETARLDNPRLDLRMLEGEQAPPRPVVFDGKAVAAPQDLDWAEREPILLLPEGVEAAAHADAGWTIQSVPANASDGEGLDLATALELLADRHEIASLLVEGGGRLLSAFLAAGLWQRWELFLAPRFFPADGRPLWTELAEREGLRIENVQRRGEDVQISLLPPAREEA